MSSISVIVPVHNAGRKLHQCIRSIHAQTYKDWRLLLIDDGSADESLRIGEAYSKQDSRIQVYSQPRSGSIAARRKGIELSQSPFVTFVDADDWIDRAMLERLHAASLSSDADISVCDMYRVVGGQGWVRKAYESGYFCNERVYAGAEILSGLVPAFLHGHPFPVQFHGKLYKRELLLSSGTYMSRIRFFGDDLYYNLEMFLQASTVHLLPERLYNYRIGGSTSRYMPDLFADVVNGYRIQKEIVDRHYQTDKSHHDFGIKVMLLNTFRTCVKHLWISPYSKAEKLSAILHYCSDPDVRECAANESAAGHFAPAYIRAIQNSDVRFLYRLGKRDYMRGLPKKILVNAATKMIT